MRLYITAKNHLQKGFLLQVVFGCGNIAGSPPLFSITFEGKRLPQSAGCHKVKLP